MSAWRVFLSLIIIRGMQCPAALMQPITVIGQNEEPLSNYFDILEDTFNEHKLHDKPASVFNMDKTGIPL